MDQNQLLERVREVVWWLMPSRRPTPNQLRWAIRIAVLFGVAFAFGYAYDITLWDWLKLLIVPVVIAAGTIWFNQRQQVRQQHFDKEQRDREKRSADLQRERELKIANQRSQHEALQGYLGEISQLLTDKDRPLGRARPGDPLSAVARALTLSVLDRLEGGRHKRQVLQLLYESDLITKGHRVFPLRAANLKNAFLSGLNLSRADLRGAQLDEANLFQANLQEADLGGAHMIKANLQGAHFQGAALHGARMHQADLRRANFTNSVTQLASAGLYSTVITDLVTQQEAFLDSATMPDGQKFESWLTTSDGQKSIGWLENFLFTPEGQSLWEQPDAQEWFINWLETPEGQFWLKTPGGQHFLSVYNEVRGENGENSGPS